MRKNGRNFRRNADFLREFLAGAAAPGTLRPFMSRILIVEDDPAILCGLNDNLELDARWTLFGACH
jgi:hypothetical protein